MTQQENIKELPYGVSDFLTVANENLYFVDKSMYIPKLEKEGRNLFFIRPRRFGKSIFVSMLHAYYDCKTTPSSSRNGSEVFGLVNTPRLCKANSWCSTSTFRK